MNKFAAHGLISEMEEIEDYFYLWGTDREKAAVHEGKEFQKTAGVQAHLALHRYVSSSASPNEVNYLKALGLVPRSGKKNKGRKEKSPKYLPKTAGARLSPEAQKRRKKRVESDEPSANYAKAMAGGALYGGILSTAGSSLFEPIGSLTRSGLARRALPIAALTAAGFAGAEALRDKAAKTTNRKKRMAYGTAQGMVEILASLAPMVIPVALAIRSHQASALRASIPPLRPGVRIKRGEVLKFPTGKATRFKNRVKSHLGLTPKKNGVVIPFPGMSKLSAVLGSMISELEKIAGMGDAGATLKDVQTYGSLGGKSANPEGHVKVPVRRWVVGGYTRSGAPKMKYETQTEEKGGMASSSSGKWGETPKTTNVGENETPTASA